MTKNRGFISLFSLLAVAFSVTFSACTVDTEVSKVKNNAFTISQIASSTTSTTISWPGHNTLDYTIRVYRNAELTDLFQEYHIAGHEVENNRFTIPYLTCKSAYYITVEDSNGDISTPLSVELEENIARRNIVSLNFDNLHWGYDYVNSACGVRLDNKISSSLSS